MLQQGWIKTTLKERGRKLKDVAEILGITSPRMTDIINGKRELQSDEIIPLAEIMSMSPKSLLKSIELGKKTLVAEDSASLPILGKLFGNGNIAALTESDKITQVATPPDASHSDGLYCYMMGDNSMAQEIKPDDILIAADPRKHHYPMTPGGLFLIKLAENSIALRQLVVSDEGEHWLVPLPESPNPAYTSWRFSMLPAALTEGAKNNTENGDQKTVYTADIFAAVLWVHRRYTAS